jgi:co-chaperonin GroES (HSP10)
VVASAIGLGGLGFVLADGKDGGKPTPPIPTQLGAATGIPNPPAADRQFVTSLHVDLDWKHREAAAGQIMNGIEPNAAISDQVLLQTTCLRMPTGFCDEAGLTSDQAVGMVWTLTPRETRLLFALIKSTPKKEFVSSPSLVTRSNCAVAYHSADPIEAVTQLEESVQNGKTVYIPTTRKLDLGVSLTVTPKISADGKRVLLTIESNSAELLGGIIEIPIKPTRDAKENKQSLPVRIVGPGSLSTNALRVSAEIGNGETVVIRSAPDAKKKQELIWMLTVHLSHGKK